MAFNDASSFYDIVFVLEDATLIYHFKNSKTETNYLSNDRFDTLENALESLSTKRKFYVVTSGEHFFHEELCVDFELKDEKLLRTVIDEQLDKNPGISEKLVYNYELLPAKNNDNKICYQIFGFSAKEYEALVKTIGPKKNMHILTSSRELLYSFTKTQALPNEAYIAIYRFQAIDILIVSRGDQLIFSRVSKNGTQEEQEDILRSLHYVTQRFKMEEVSLYLGGDLITAEKIKESIGSSTNLSMKLLPEAGNAPSFLEGVKHIPSIHNFLPQQIKAKRFFERLVLSSSSFLMLIVLFVGLSTLGSFTQYQAINVDYEQLQDRYEKQLAVFSATQKRDLEKLHALTQLKKDASNTKLFSLLETLMPLQAMKVESFQWEKNTRENFSIGFSKKFSDLSSYALFVEKVKQFKQLLRKSYPKSTLTQTEYLNELMLKVTIVQKRNVRRRSRRGMGYE